MANGIVIAPGAARNERTLTLSSGWQFWRRPHTFRVGLLCGVALVIGLRWVINKTTVADRIVAPLVWADTPGQADAIVVLGAGIVGDCIGNTNALRRTMLAARLWRAGRAPRLVITGGRPTGLPCPISGVMAATARELGVPADRITVETESHSTHENAERSDPMLRRLGVRRILVVTDRLHMTRAGEAFARYGYQIERSSVPVFEGHPDNVSMLAAGLREYCALVYYRWRGWLAPFERDGGPRVPGAGSTAVAFTAGSAGGSVQQTLVRHPDGPVVILGASYAAGWKPTSQRLRFSNKGVAGQQSFQLLERFDRDVVPDAPRAVLVWGFINDVFRAPAGGSDAALARARTTLSEIVVRARAQGIEPLLATEVTITSPSSWSETLGQWLGWVRGKPPYHAGINRQVRETNAWLRDYARREQILLLDFESVLADTSGDRQAAFAKEDGSHISPAGYAALTSYAVPRLEAHIAR
jgi:uncharacterized SAM-binding protein YcdF (DUF218 family)